MRYLIIYTNGMEDRIYAKTFEDFLELLRQSAIRYQSRIDLIYCLGM